MPLLIVRYSYTQETSKHFETPLEFLQRPFILIDMNLEVSFFFFFFLVV
jgi:hypothetical protein